MTDLGTGGETCGPAGGNGPAPFWSARIIARAAEMYGFTPAQLTCPDRSARYREPRILAARALRQLGMNSVEIGRKLHRDRTTAIWACGEAERLIARHRHARLAFEEIVNAGWPGFYPLEDAA